MLDADALMLMRCDAGAMFDDADADAYTMMRDARC
jgi:hypothetical protein